MGHRDHYYNKAKQQGYRARSAYKLLQLDEAAHLLGRGDTVVDLGAAPGGWLQVAAERVGKGGTVVGVDLQRIKPLDETHGATVETIRGDMTDEETRERIREVAGDEVDLVLSDMAPNMTGEYSLDQARSFHLAGQAIDTALALLTSGGDVAVKVFDGPDVDDLRATLDREFQYVRTTVPKASRAESSEIYLIGKGRLTAPVRAGDQLDVEIEDLGSEGDGIASVEGFRLFVPDTEPGDAVTVRVTDVKPRFGFAERVE